MTIPSAITLTIVQPINFTFTPQPDITAYEFALISQYLYGHKPMYEADWTALGTATRHLTKL